MNGWFYIVSGLFILCFVLFLRWLAQDNRE